MVPRTIQRTSRSYWKMARVKKTLVINHDQDDKLIELNEKYDVDQSFVVRRALKYYFEEGMKRDKIFKEMINGNL